MSCSVRKVAFQKVGTYLSSKSFDNTSGPRSRIDAFRPERLGHVVDVDDFAAF
jgi:hypothetical protein